ncbi:MAG TPA: GAF domain-containing sensor histidine kinase [Phototrophicaceae bacterium]|jgi:signal transduction histidine kinase|nr:GAF domain-containing sensor histidine kinase [Phototrophicaceae bacterium]
MIVKSSGRLEDQDRDQLLQTARRLLAEADALSSRIAAVGEIGIAINRTLDLDEIQRVIARQAKWLLDFDHCSVGLCEGETWQINTLFGATEPAPPDLMATENAGRAVKYSQPQLIRTGSPSPFLSSYKSQIIIPLVADSSVVGIINFAATSEQCYSQDDMRIGYMLALQLASAIRNARNFLELKRTRDELRQYATELEARNQELNAYSHTIAHDLKSPLNSIMLRSEIVVMKYGEQLPGDAVETLRGINDSGVKLNDMIDQLLWLAKSRHIDETVKSVDVNQLVKSVQTRFTELTNRIQIEVATSLPAALGHAQWIEEVFANLISNAIKYIGEHNPAPRIQVRGSIMDGMARYEVEDNGIGIAPDDQARLFEMFTRLHTVQAEGLGLGLSIVHRMVTRLNGKVGVISNPGQGSTFWFTLPLSATGILASLPEK